MKVKIGDTFYSSDDQPIMVILTAQDRINITAMLPNATKYCEFDRNKFTKEYIREWMDDDDS